MGRILGLLFAFLLAVVAMFLSDAIHFNDILLALILGILVGNLTRIPENWSKGISWASGLILELAILLMAFSIDYKQLLSLGWQTIVVIVMAIAVTLIGTVLLARRMKFSDSTAWLIGFGTAICGSSAIAALAPTVARNKSDIGIALAIVNLYGLIGMILLPFIGPYLLNEMQNGILIGASLHSVGNVAGAGFAMSDHIGELAVTVKLGRVALLTPTLFIFRGFLTREARPEGKRRIQLPWYLVGFIVISVVASVIDLPTEVLNGAKWTSNLFLATAMAAIGLKMSFKTLFESGKRGMLFGGLLFAISLLAIITMLYTLY